MEKRIELYVQTENLQGADEVLEGLNTGSISTAQAVALLEKRLLVLRLSFGKVKAALERLIAPLANLLLPVLSRAMVSLAAFINRMAKVVTAIFGGAEAGEDMAKSQKTLQKSLKATSRELARFDTLDRIGQLTGGGEEETVTVNPPEDKLTPALQAMVQRIHQLLLPLKSIDLSHISRAFRELRAALAPITHSLFSGLEWAWHNLLVPLARWVAEDALPVFLRMLAAAMETLGAVCEALKPVAQWLFANFLQPLAVWTGQQIINAMEGITQKLRNFTGWVEENQGKVYSFISVLEWLATAWNTVSAAVQRAWNFLHPQEDFFSRLGKNAINGVISMINAMLGAVSSGINALVRSINKLSFTVPGWVPALGGQKFGFNLSTVSFPKIPLLAQGAVLPANKPFLAVVGDQKNGTNIEAPLSTIQQALAEVLAKQGMQEITVQFAGDLAQLGRVLRPVIRQEDRRAGTSLAKGVAV